MVKSNIIYEVKDEAFWVSYIKNRIEDNQNFIGIFTGATGSGKTYSALSVAEQIDPNFNVKKQCIFKFKDALALINSEWFKDELQWKIIVWDEPQIELSNRSWQSRLNKFINYLLTTFRHRNVILLFASPYKSFLDSQSMKLVHAEFKCQGWDGRTKLCKVKPRLLQYNDDKQKIYPQKLYIHTIKDGFQGLDIWEINKVSDKFAEEYEELKTSFTTKLYTEMDKDINEGNKQKVIVKNQKDYNQELEEFGKIYELANGKSGIIINYYPNKSISTIKHMSKAWRERKERYFEKPNAPYLTS